ncbi:MAG: FxsA family protein [Hyphomicrobiaceae bacterium]|nr:FxsA family protein [Hyphomicrobiaceae bacterium]
MRLFFFLLFIAVPLAELAILIKVGEIIGVLPTVLLVIMTAVIGVALLKRQGIAALAGARQSLEAGKFPVDSVVDGACLLVAGAFLLTPGLITDTVGFLLLVPGLRRGLAHWLFDKMVKSGNMHFQTFGMGNEDSRGDPRQDSAPSGAGPTIETEYTDLDTSEPEQSSSNYGKRDRSKSPWRK